MNRDRIVQIVSLVLAFALVAGAGAFVPRLIRISDEEGLRYTDVSIDGAPPIAAETRLILPSRPSATIAIALTNRLNVLRCCVPTWTIRPVSFWTLRINFPSSIVSVKGFSQ